VVDGKVGLAGEVMKGENLYYRVRSASTAACIGRLSDGLSDNIVGL
jgi:hypothetical protein